MLNSYLELRGCGNEWEFYTNECNKTRRRYLQNIRRLETKPRRVTLSYVHWSELYRRNADIRQVKANKIIHAKKGNAPNGVAIKISQQDGLDIL